MRVLCVVCVSAKVPGILSFQKLVFSEVFVWFFTRVVWRLCESCAFVWVFCVGFTWV